MNNPSEVFEIHLTVQKLGGISIEDFTEHCHAINVTPLLLELQRNATTVVQEDVMTSSTICCSEPQAFAHANDIWLHFTAMGYQVIRFKLETTTKHPRAPSLANDYLFNADQYFECHFGIKTNHKRVFELLGIAEKHKCHLSTNIFKKHDDGTMTIMMTLRRCIPLEHFTVAVEEICSSLESSFFTYESPIIEFCLFDNKITHDSKWMARHEKNA